MMGCVIKEEIDIPFDEVENFWDQQTLYEESSVDSPTVHPTSIDTNVNMEIKNNILPINIKKELSEDMIRLRCEMPDIYINKDPSDSSVRPRLVNEDLMDTAEKPQSINEDLTEQHQAVNEEKKTQERRVLRKRKVKIPDVEKKQAKKGVENKRADKRELRERKAKSTSVTGEQLQKKKYCPVKSRISPLIRQECPNCELTLEKESHVVRKCFKCQTPFVYVCVKCSKQYDRKESIKNHLDTKCHPRTIHSCQLCKYRSTKYDHMKRHVLRTHNVKVDNLSTLIQSTNLRA